MDSTQVAPEALAGTGRRDGTAASAAPGEPTLRAHALRNTFWLGVAAYLLVFFSPWTMAGMELAVLLLHGLVLWHRAVTPVQAWLPRWVWLPFVGLAAMALLSTAAANAPLTSLDESRGIYRMFLPFVLLPALAQVPLRRLLTLHVAVMGLVALYGLVQHQWAAHILQMEVEHPYHARGSFTSYLTYAGVVMLAVPVYASLAMALRGRERWVCGGVALLGALAVLVSMSRAGWLGLATALLVLVLALRLPRRWAVTVVLLGTLVVMGMAALVFSGTLREWLGMQHLVSTRSSPTVVNRLLSFEETLHSPRLTLMDAGLRGLLARPLLGHGFDGAEFAPYREAARADWGLPPWPKPDLAAHNVFLELGFAVGIPGLLLFLGMWAALIAWCIQWLRQAGGRFPQESALLWGILAALAGSLVHGMFGGNFNDSEVQVNILLWMGLALHVGLRLRGLLARG